MASEGEENRPIIDNQDRLLRATETAKMFGRPEAVGGITASGRHTSAYYQQQVLVKHADPICDEWIEQVVARPYRVTINERNGTIAYWAYIQEFGNFIRVILRERDGTLVNRFPDSKEARRGLRREIRP